MENLTITIQHTFSRQAILDLLDCAGRGSRYWNENDLEFESFAKKAVDSFTTIKDNEEDKTHKLDLIKIKSGLEIMAKDFPKDFADLVGEDYDNNTGDTFLQCCLFGNVIYS